MKAVAASSAEFVRFIDVSKWQGEIDWAAARQGGADMAIIRVSDGVKHPDPTFEQNWFGAKQVGMLRGVFQYVRPQLDAASQVRLMIDKLDAVGGLQSTDLPPVCDIEHRPAGMSSADIHAFGMRWCELVEDHLRRIPVIYTYPYFWQSVTTRPSAYPLWIADYENKPPLVPDSWQRWTMWQSTGEGTHPGVKGHVDLNVFDGSMADLKLLIAKSKFEPTWVQKTKRHIGIGLRRLYRGV